MSSFHVKAKNDNPSLQKIEKIIGEIDFDYEKGLERPIRKGTLCAAKYSEDDEWYRARVERGVGKEVYEITFIDYGNGDEAHADDLKKLP